MYPGGGVRGCIPGVCIRWVHKGVADGYTPPPEYATLMSEICTPAPAGNMHSSEHSEQAGGTHPTGLHTCLSTFEMQGQR